MQTIILLRHGYPTSWDLKDKTRATATHLRQDPALAAIGTRQAKASAAHIAAAGGAEVVWSSPFRACLETADLVAADCKVEVQADWKLGEVLLSQVLGSPFSPTSAMDPDCEDRRRGAGKPSHPESDQTIQDRVARTVLALKSHKPFAQRIVIVSHAIILQKLCQAMIGRSFMVDWHPGALTTLQRAKPLDRQWRLHGEPASFAHLGDDDRPEPADQIEVKYHPLDSRG